MPMTGHNIRVDDDLWQRAGSRAIKEGTNLSALIRQWLTAYADDYKLNRMMAESHALAQKIRKETVARLTQQGWSVTQIAAHLGVNRRTVSRDRVEVIMKGSKQTWDY